MRIAPTVKWGKYLFPCIARRWNTKFNLIVVSLQVWLDGKGKEGNFLELVGCGIAGSGNVSCRGPLRRVIPVTYIQTYKHTYIHRHIITHDPFRT